MRHDEGTEIGHRLARARREAGLTQAELAARIGVAQRSIQGYESGAGTPYRHLRQLAEAVGRPAEWLLRGDGASAGGLSDSELSSRIAEALERLVEEVNRMAAIARRLEDLHGPPPGAPGSDERL